MANTYKNIVVTPNRTTAANVVPSIQFSGGDATTNTDISLKVYTTSNGTLSFDGSAGQLFSITNDLSGVLFSVNDVSGIPSIEVDANGRVSLAQFSGNVGIGTASPSFKLDVSGDMRVTGNVILGDASTDTITLNGSVITLGNNQSFDGGTLFIDAVNNEVGIGITNPTSNLHVIGTANISGSLIVLGSNVTQAFISGNAFATAVGTSGNTFATAVGTAGNAFTTSVGTSGNAYALATATAIGTAGNTFASSVGVGANSYATSVGAAGNTFASSVGVGANAFATAVGTASNTYATSVGTAGNTFASSVGVSANTYATAVGTAGNTFASSVGVSANTYATAVGTAGNTFASSVGVSANIFATSIGASSNAWANTKVASSGGTITGNLSITGNLTVSGNTNFVSVTNFLVDDPLIYLAANNYVSDIVDIGFIGSYVNATSANVFTGLYREHADKMYYLFQGYDRVPVNNHIGALSNNMTLSVLNADIRTSNLFLFGANAQQFIISAFAQANAAPGIANSYATAVGTAGNTFATSVGTAGNTFASSVGVSANNYATSVGTAGNTFASSVGVGANAYATSVGTSGNAFAITIGTAGNTYATSVGASSNAWANTIVTAANNFAGTMANSANARANTVGAASNTFASSVGVSANTYATSVGVAGNAYATAIGTSGNTFASSVGVSANTYATAVGTAGNTFASSVGVSANTYATSVGTAGNTYTLAAFNQANSALVTAQSAFAQANLGGSSTSFTSNVVISVADNTNAALRITQTGTAAAIRVEDDTNPDSTPFVVTATGNVGIGTATPGYALDVNGTVNAAVLLVNGSTSAAINSLTGYLEITSSAGSTSLTNTSPQTVRLTGSLAHTIVLPDVTTLQLGWSFVILNASTGVLTMQSSGGNSFPNTVTSNMIARLICISTTGTTTSSWALVYEGSTNRTGTGSFVFSSSPTISAPLIANISGGSAVSSPLTLQSTTGAGNSDFIAFRTGSQLERMRIDTNGRIGIGTSAPGYELDVNAGLNDGIRANNTVFVEGSANSFVKFKAGGVDVGSLFADNNFGLSGSRNQLFIINSSSQANIIFQNGLSFTERMRIDASGNVGIGTTTPTYKLDVNGTINAAAVLVNGVPITGGGVTKFTANVGNNSANTFNIAHNLNTLFVSPAVREYATGYFVYPDIRSTTANNIVLEFISAPTTNQYAVIVVG